MSSLQEPPMLYFLAMISIFVFVFLKAWQQQNIAHRTYWWIMPTSMLMAVTEVYSVSIMAKNGLGWIVVFVGVGAGLGGSLSAYLHHRFLIKEKPCQQ